MNRTLSARRRSSTNTGRRRFSISTFRGLQHPQLSKKMNRVIKSENAAIAAHESAARQRMSIAAQVSDWGETTGDEAISDVSDKLGVLLAEMGEQEDTYAQNLEEYRAVLKHIRDTEGSVQPTRDQRTKLSDDIQRLKLKEPNSHKLETMEQELVRAEAQNLVAEAQLTNVTRQRFKEAYNTHLAAVIERGEKQVLLARHARRLLDCLDDTSVIPGDEPKEYVRGHEAKQIVDDAERELHSWESNLEPVEIADTGAGAVPARTSPPSSARAVRGEPAAKPQAAESLEGEPEETQVEETQAEETQAEEAQAEAAQAGEVPPLGDYSRISAKDEAPRPRVHSMTAPMMDADALEGRAPSAETSAANRVRGLSSEDEVTGLDSAGERQKALVPESTQNINAPRADTGFAFRTKEEPTSLGTPLDAHVQRLAVPI
ncbi:Eisosome component PIL1-domain-containing protein [Aspergillus aurantiobrunneus]